MGTVKDNVIRSLDVASSLKAVQTTDGAIEHKSLRVVVFSLVGLEQAIEVEQVEEIIMAPVVAPLIKAPFFVDGVIKLRGKIVPVVDLKKAMRFTGASDSGGEKVIVMVRLWGHRIGFRVDSVLELLTIPLESIEPPKGVVGGVDSRFMKGLTYIGDRFLVILDLEAMLSEDQEMIFQNGNNLKEMDESLDSASLDDKYATRRIISFVLDREIFGVDMGEVAEIMEVTAIMPVPNVPDFVLGLINLRGTIVPVVDFRVLFGLDTKPWTADSRIVIMQDNNLLVGVVVDSMWESLRLAREAFQPAPQSVARIDYEYFKDITLVNSRVVSILNISRILADTLERRDSHEKSQDVIVSGGAPRLESQIWSQ